LAKAGLRDSLAVMGDIIPFWRKKKKKQLDWIQGITPRKTQSHHPQPNWRMPPALPGGLVIAVMIAMMIWVF